MKSRIRIYGIICKAHSLFIKVNYTPAPYTYLALSGRGWKQNGTQLGGCGPIIHKVKKSSLVKLHTSLDYCLKLRMMLPPWGICSIFWIHFGLSQLGVCCWHRVGRSQGRCPVSYSTQESLPGQGITWFKMLPALTLKSPVSEQDSYGHWVRTKGIGNYIDLFWKVRILSWPFQVMMYISFPRSAWLV